MENSPGHALPEAAAPPSLGALETPAEVATAAGPHPQAMVAADTRAEARYPTSRLIGFPWLLESRADRATRRLRWPSRSRPVPRTGGRRTSAADPHEDRNRRAANRDPT